MSTPNTASNFINIINQNYPVAGQDNNSQGFRNNFTNIKQALTWLDNDVYSLQVTTVQKNQDNDFDNNIIEKATFKDCSVLVYDNTDIVTTGDVVVNYENGSYQKFKVSAGYHNFTFENWPDTLKTGKLTLYVETDSTTGATVDFTSFVVNNLGPDSFPIEITTDGKIFEIWNDGDSGKIFIQHHRYVDKENTTTSAVETLVIGTNVYNTVTNTASTYATVVKANNKAANLALVPNRIFGTVIAAPLPVIPGATTSTAFKINSTNGILAGATFNLPFSTAIVPFNVQSCTTDTVTVSPPFETTALNIGNVITFINPEFTDQAKVVTWKATVQNTTTSAPNDLQGTIYASSTTFYVAHSNHRYNQQTWLAVTADHMPQNLVLGSNAVTMPATNSSTFIATTAHVKNAIDYVLPRGMIVLWSGASTAIPTGWALCNGSNGTPDLRSRFIIGAGGSYSVGWTGGSTTSGEAGGHTHTGTVSTSTFAIPITGYTANNIPLGSATAGTLIVASGLSEVGETLESVNAASAAPSFGNNAPALEISAVENHTHSVIPPYYALCYIMKL